MRRVLVVLIALSVLLVAGCADESVDSTATVETVELTLLVRNATPPVEESFRPGDTVRIKDSGTELGAITGVAVEQSRTAVPDSQGVLQESPSPILVDIVLTIEGEAAVSDRGFRFGSEIVYVNNDIRYLTPLVQFGGIITGMRVVGE